MWTEAVLYTNDAIVHYTGHLYYDERLYTLYTQFFVEMPFKTD